MATSNNATPTAQTRNQTQNPIHQYGQSGRSVRHSKEDALTPREFEFLLEGARELSRSPYYYRPDPEMTIYVLGRLGLRRSELVHLREEWIDWPRQMIVIPSFEDCTIGQDGGVCGDCRQSAMQRVDHADGELEFEQACEWMWAPKTEAGAREIYFGHDVRAQIYLERYFDSPEYHRYQASGTAVARRVDKAAELGGIDPESIYAHALRASAATHLIAERDLGVYQLMQYMGWKRIATAEAYLSRNSQKTARVLDGF